MADYIRREDALDAIGKLPVYWDDDDDYEDGYYTRLSIDINTIESLEPADVVPVVHSYWEGEETDCNIKCHKCGKAFRDYIITQDYADLSEYPNFCPNCGAKMDGEE